VITFLGLSPALDVTYLVETVVPGAIHRPASVRALPGGKSLNAARAASALSGDARAIAPLGGFTGERVAAGLRSSGIRVRVVPAAAETRACVTVFGTADPDPTEFYEPAPQLSADEFAEVARAVREVRHGWIALSGSVPAGHVSEIAGVLADAAARGIRLAVDTHGPALAALLDAAPPAVVKVNRAEASELLGDGAAEDLADGLRRRGATTAIVTDGAAGAVLASAGGVWRAAPPERGRYAVGSGDCFLAGILVALDADAADQEALALATAAATANTLQPGASVFDPRDLDRLRAAVEVVPARRAELHGSATPRE
jgi:1-phosphofructokinase family hexose kinase